MSDVSLANENPLLQIDTSFRTYLNAYTRSYQNHIVDGVLDYAFESDFAVRQKILGLGGSGKLFKAAGGTDVAAEAKVLFMKCNQVGPLKYPEIYDILKKCSERLELVVPIVFVREDIDKPLIYSISSDMIDPCIVITKKMVDTKSLDELTFLVGSECGKLQNNHCVYNMAFTYLNYNKQAYRPAERTYNQTVSKQLYAALVQWVNFADITSDRAGMICLDKPGRFIDVICSVYADGYVDFYGRQQEGIDSFMLQQKAESIGAVGSRNLTADPSLSELERRILASAQFLNCQTLYEWRRDLDDKDQTLSSAQISDVRSSILLGNGGQLDG